MVDVVNELIASASRLRDASQSIARRIVSEGVADLVYNPLNYAWEVHEAVSYTHLTLPTICSV